MCGMIGRSVSPIACTSSSASDVPARGVKCTSDEEAADVGALGAGRAKRECRLGETGSAVRFACFLRILRVASPVANWN